MNDPSAAGLYDALGTFLQGNPSAVDKQALKRYLESNPFRADYSIILPLDELERKLEAINRMKTTFEYETGRPFQRVQFAVLLAAPLGLLEEMSHFSSNLVYRAADFLEWCMY